MTEKEIIQKIFEELAKDELMKYDNFGLDDLKKYAKKFGVNL